MKKVITVVILLMLITSCNNLKNSSLASSQINKHKVTFYDDSGQLIKTLEIASGEVFDLNKEVFIPNFGYEFLGWSSDYENFSNNLTVNTNIKLTPLIKRKLICIKDNNLLQSLMLNTELNFNNNCTDFLEAQNIKSLILKNSNIDHIDDLANFTRLEFIDITGNNVTTLVPLLDLINLKTIKVANNKLPYSVFSVNEVDIKIEELELLRQRGVSVQNAYLQKVNNQVKTLESVDYIWKTLVVFVSEIDGVIQGGRVVSEYSEETVYLAEEYTRLFDLAVNRLVPLNVLVDVDFYSTNQVHRTKIETYITDNDELSYFVWAKDNVEIAEKSKGYDSVLVLHSIKGNSGSAGYGFFDPDLYAGSVSIRLDSFMSVHNGFFGYENVKLVNKIEQNYMDWGVYVMIHEFIHTLEFYGKHNQLPIWDLHESASFYEEKIIDDYGNYFFERSLTRDYLWYLGYLRGDYNPNTKETGIIKGIWEFPPSIRG
jgi:hypothetical protein